MLHDNYCFLLRVHCRSCRCFSGAGGAVEYLDLCILGKKKKSLLHSIVSFGIGLLIFFNILNINPPKTIAQFSHSGDQLVEQLSASL